MTGTAMLWTGRINRATYWTLLIATIGLIAAIIMITTVHVPGEVVIALIVAPRLRDIGVSAWWILAGVAFEVVGAVSALVFLPENSALIAEGFVVLALFGMLVWLGCIRGEPGENRFGPQPLPGVFGRSAMKQG